MSGTKAGQAVRFFGASFIFGCWSLCCVVFSGCANPNPKSNLDIPIAGPSIESYMNPTSEDYMNVPTAVRFPDSASVFLTDGEYAEFQNRLQGFLETNNESEFRAHFEDFYIPEVFKPDSLFELYIRMYHQWDSIGVTNRLDRWSLRYVSPFFEGEIYDVALAEVDIRHHMVFEKRWTGNYRNFGRTLSQRYPGAKIDYMDTTFVSLNGDTIYRRLITSETPRLIYAVRGHGDDLRPKDIRWLNDGWQLQPGILPVMDSTAVAKADLHWEQNGILKQRPSVSGR